MKCWFTRDRHTGLPDGVAFYRLAPAVLPELANESSVLQRIGNLIVELQKRGRSRNLLASIILCGIRVILGGIRKFSVGYKIFKRREQNAGRNNSTRIGRQRRSSGLCPTLTIHGG